MAEADGPRISISEVGMLPGSPGNIQQKDGVPTQYSITVMYYGKSGWQMMPVSGPDGTPASFVKWSARYQYMVVYWLAKRIGDWPIPPSPEPPDDNCVFLDGEPWHHSPEFLPGSKAYEYTIGGWYRYGMKVPIPEAELYKKCAKVPFDGGTHPGIDPTKLKKLFT